MPDTLSSILAHPNLRGGSIEVRQNMRYHDDHQFIAVLFLGVIRHGLIEDG